MSSFKKVAWSLEKVTTKDGLGLDGVIAEPTKKTHTGVLFLHGLGSSFSGSIARNEPLGHACLQRNIACAIFNTRGHDAVASFTKRTKGARKGKMVYGGMAFEKFEDCILDIQAMLQFLRKRGYKNIFLVGHSTGSNKALYYLYKTRDRAVKGLCLAGPLSDLAIEMRRLGKSFYPTLRRVKSFAKTHPRNALLLSTIINRLMTARRYLSLHTAGSNEDVFPYTRPNASWKEFKSIRVPLLVVIGSGDAYLDRTPKAFLKIFQAHANGARTFTGIVVPGGDHSFRKREKEFANAVTQWVKSV